MFDNRNVKKTMDYLLIRVVNIIVKVHTLIKEKGAIYDGQYEIMIYLYKGIYECLVFFFFFFLYNIFPCIFQ
jgi:hypothetical protein